MPAAIARSSSTLPSARKRWCSKLVAGVADPGCIVPSESPGSATPATTRRRRSGPAALPPGGDAAEAETQAQERVGGRLRDRREVQEDIRAVLGEGKGAIALGSAVQAVGEQGGIEEDLGRIKAGDAIGLKDQPTVADQGIEVAQQAGGAVCLAGNDLQGETMRGVCGIGQVDGTEIEGGGIEHRNQVGRLAGA